MASSRIDMAQLAKMLGVAQSTVSRALAGKPGVSAATRFRIKDAANKAGFNVSVSASRLAGGKSNTVALLVDRPYQWYQSAIIAQATELLQAAGFDALLYNLSDSSRHVDILTRSGLEEKADGVLVVSASLTRAEESMLGSLSLPVVGVGTALHDFSFVTVDNEAEIAVGVRHLFRLHHRRIGLIQGGGDLRVVSNVTQERGDGFRRAMGDHYEHAYVVRVKGDDSEAGGSGVAALLALSNPPTAIVTETDLLAAGALQAARRLGLSAPRDFSIVGFDDSPIAEVLDLTTIRQNVPAQVKQAVALLLDELAGAGNLPGFALLPCSLVIRSTSQDLPPA